ncbi:MAG: hypothetical protein CVT71_03135 [Alphaproteobacteria bacterium HGW-Alphaproteobacteria-10]|nr:MAG: hypothetical protein CVT71_03135 [Alphaproteobacteria bacterium HGW-Alphaproteobacteria-10]
MPGAARKAYEAARRVTSWAVGRGKLEHDPFARMAPPAKGAPKERALDDRELSIAWRAAGELGYPFGPMCRLLIVTATRRNEAADMTWGELDNADAPALWRIPAERAKNGLEHRIPLSAQARAIIAGLPRWRSPFVFSTTDGERPVSGFNRAVKRLARAVAAIVEREGGKPVEPFTLHDLRRTARTGLARLGVGREVAERALNHVGGSVLERTYNRHRYEVEIGRALQTWGDHVESVSDVARAGRVVVKLHA